MRRALIIANKWWETDPLVAVLSSPKTCPPFLKFIRRDDPAGFRGVFEGGRACVEIWCLQDRMSARASGSSSEEKAHVLPSMLGDDDIALVVAFGTAATPTSESYNGCVVAGTNVFVHDAKVAKTSSHWIVPRPDIVIASALSQDAFAAIIGGSVSSRVSTLSLPALAAPAAERRLIADWNLVALASVNVTDYHDYKTADQAVVDAYKRVAGDLSRAGSLETTHGVIRSCLADEVPFMFVSGITDRVGFFDEEVGKAPYPQNFTAAHNAGVAVAAMIPAILTFLSPD